MIAARLQREMTHCLNQRGAILIGLIISITVITGIGAAIMSLTTGSTYMEASANLQDRSYYLSESGARYALPLVKQDIQNGVTTNISQLHNQTFTVNSGGSSIGQFKIEVDDSNSSYTEVHSTGMLDVGASFGTKVEISYRMAKNYTLIFDHALFGGDKITVNNDAEVYGDVGTNGGEGSIEILADGQVFGDQYTDVGKTFPSLSLPSGDYSQDLVLSDDITMTLNTGSYFYKEVLIQNESVLNISGNVILYVEEDFNIIDKGQITIMADSSLKVYVGANISLSDLSKINIGGDAEDFTLYGTTSCTSVVINTRAEVVGAIYASDANVTIDNVADVTGSVVAKEIEIKNQAVFTYDQDLNQSGGNIITLTDPIQYYTS